MSSSTWQGRSTFQHFSKAASEGVVPAGLSPLSVMKSLVMNSKSMLGVLLGRRYEECWKALYLFTEAQEQILCTFQSRSMPVWLRLSQMLQSYLTIHSYCLHKCSLNLLYASPFASLFFPPPKQLQYLLRLNLSLFNTKPPVS